VPHGQIVSEKVGPESKMQEKPLVLILCTGNSYRSHLAEGILRQKARDLIRLESAGSKPAGFVHPLAIRAMEEIGIDISGHRSKHLEEFLDRKVHTVVTVCGYADQACPIFPGSETVPPGALTIRPKLREVKKRFPLFFAGCATK
jgi:protein-tyrosine-phosphatase